MLHFSFASLKMPKRMRMVQIFSIRCFNVIILQCKQCNSLMQKGSVGGSMYIDGYSST